MLTSGARVLDTIAAALQCPSDYLCRDGSTSASRNTMNAIGKLRGYDIFPSLLFSCVATRSSEVSNITSVYNASVCINPLPSVLIYELWQMLTHSLLV